MNASCGNCDAFLANKDIKVKLGFARQGWCRANPPVLVQVVVRETVAGQGSTTGFQGMFTPTASDCWCRQWQRKGVRPEVIDLEVSDATTNKPAA